MNLVFIYGSPAVGKLTVSEELVKITNYKIFHNHLTIDYLSEIFELSSQTFKKLSKKIRLQIIEEAFKSDLNGLIFTFSYGYKDDDLFIKKILEISKHNKGEISFVHLSCEKNQLLKRVKTKSRKKYGKLKSAIKLAKMIKKHNYYKSIPYVKSLEIDNTDVSAKGAALKIKKHFNL